MLRSCHIEVVVIMSFPQAKLFLMVRVRDALTQYSSKDANTYSSWVKYGLSGIDLKYKGANGFFSASATEFLKDLQIIKNAF